MFVVRDFKLRKAISKLRLSSHDLMVEKGRHSKPKTPLEERTCPFSSNNVVEDEQHFVLECPTFSKQRSLMLNNILQHTNFNNNDEVNFISILSSKDENILFSLGKYLTKCFKMRKNILSKKR